MCSFYFKAIPLAFVLLVSACSQFGAVPERHDPSVPEGPGLFTGASGDFSVGKLLNPNKNGKSRSRDITVTGSDVDVPAIDLDSFEEFERFKAWRRAQEKGSAEYKDWQEFQEFQRLKKENEG